MDGHSQRPRAVPVTLRHAAERRGREDSDARSLSRPEDPICHGACLSHPQSWGSAEVEEPRLDGLLIAIATLVNGSLGHGQGSFPEWHGEGLPGPPRGDGHLQQRRKRPGESSRETPGAESFQRSQECGSPQTREEAARRPRRAPEGPGPNANPASTSHLPTARERSLPFQAARFVTTRYGNLGPRRRAAVGVSLKE